MAFRRSSPFYERVRAIAEEYARLSNGKIELEIVDPLRSPDRMQEVTAAYGLTLVRDMIIIDARTDDSAVTTEDANKTKVLNPHVKLVVAEDMGVFRHRRWETQAHRLPGRGCAHRPPRRIHRRPARARWPCWPTRAASTPRTELRRANRWKTPCVSKTSNSANSISPASTDIPDDISGIVLAAPKYDLTDEELAVLERYWNKPRAAILVLIDSGDAPPKLRAFLRGNGITPRKDRVIAREKNTLVTAARGIFTKGIDFTRDLAGQTTEFGGASSSLDVREGAEDLLNRRIYPMGLIEVPAGFWGETKFGQGNEAFDEKEDNKPPLYLAACVTRGAESDDRFAADTSRMVVISNTDFLDPKNHRAENLDFLASSVNWLVGRESLAGIGPRSLGTYKLPHPRCPGLLHQPGEPVLPARLPHPDRRLRLVVTPRLTRHALPRHPPSFSRSPPPLLCALAGWQWRQGNFDSIFGAPPTPVGQRIYASFTAGRGETHPDFRQRHQRHLLTAGQRLAGLRPVDRPHGPARRGRHHQLHPRHARRGPRRGG